MGFWGNIFTKKKSERHVLAQQAANATHAMKKKVTDIKLENTLMGAMFERIALVMEGTDKLKKAALSEYEEQAEREDDVAQEAAQAALEHYQNQQMLNQGFDPNMSEKERLIARALQTVERVGRPLLESIINQKKKRISPPGQVIMLDDELSGVGGLNQSVDEWTPAGVASRKVLQHVSAENTTPPRPLTLSQPSRSSEELESGEPINNERVLHVLDQMGINPDMLHLFGIDPNNIDLNRLKEPHNLERAKELLENCQKE